MKQGETSVRTDVREAVLGALVAVLGDSPHEAIDDSTRPIGDLGLVSADGIDLALELIDRLGCTIKDDLNPLVSDKGRARTVAELVAWVEKLPREQEPVSDE